MHFFLFSSFDIDRANELCGSSYQCKYDYAMSLDRDMAHFTLNYYVSYTEIREINEDIGKLKRLISKAQIATEKSQNRS